MTGVQTCALPIFVDLGKVEGILPDRFYPKTEKYNVGDRVQALLYEVKDTENGGAEVVLSRSHPEFVEQLFLLEVPELKDGTITIERIVRDAGYRTKIAVTSSDFKVDPVGACVGVRGTRVKNIIRELNNEKIDIIPYSDDPVKLLQNALAPIEAKKIQLFSDKKMISIIVDEENYATVLGKKGTNARLNGALIGLELQVQKWNDYQAIMKLEREQIVSEESPELDESLSSIEGLNPLIIENLASSGYDTLRKILSATPHELSTNSGISLEMADNVLEDIFHSYKPKPGGCTNDFYWLSTKNQCST